jgi:hypothetical protein
MTRAVAPRFRHRGGMGNLSTCRDCRALVSRLPDGTWVCAKRDGTLVLCPGTVAP